MSAAKHTPGPWSVKDDNGIVASIVDAGGSHFARVKVGDTLSNARLIAAAPELLAALVEIADPCALRSAEGFRMIARAAIAKATGGAA